MACVCIFRIPTLRRRKTPGKRRKWFSFIWSFPSFPSTRVTPAAIRTDIRWQDSRKTPGEMGGNKNQIHRDNPHKMPPIHSIIIFYQTNISKGLRRFQIENERIVQSSGFQHLRKEKGKTGRISSLRCEEAIKKRPPCYSHVILYNLLYTFLSFLRHGNNTQGTTAAL